MKLDRFIQENLESFNSGEPPDGHPGRFKTKLVREHLSRVKAMRINLLKIAALVVFIFLATALFIREFSMFQSGRVDLITTTGENELEEAENYYSGLMDDYYGRLDRLDFQGNREEKALIMRELQEMDLNVEVMKNDLRKDPDNEIIINAIISHYQIKLELMNDIITRIEKTGISLL